MFKVLYINLERDVKRKEHMESMFKVCGLEYQRIQAIDGRILSKEEIVKVYDEDASNRKNKKGLTLGELGCALSHKKMYELALASNSEYTLMCEDDIVLPVNFKTIVEKEIEKNNKNKKWDYLQFDYPETGLIFIIRWFASVKLFYNTHIKSDYWHKNLVEKIKFFFYTFLKMFYIMPMSIFEATRNKIQVGPKRFYRPLYFAGCYLVTPKAAKELLDMATPIIFSADRIHNQARIKGLSVMAYCPLVVKQDRRGLGSSILGVDSIDY